MENRKEQIWPGLWKLVDDALERACDSVHEHRNVISRELKRRRERLEAKGIRCDPQGHIVTGDQEEEEEEDATDKHIDQIPRMMWTKVWEGMALPHSSTLLAAENARNISLPRMMTTTM
jgi:hypothetical protein